MLISVRRLMFITIFLSMALAFTSLAQTPVQRPCDVDAKEKRGGWVQGPDAGVGYGWHPLTPKNRRQIATLLDGVAAHVKKAYPDPVGSQGKFYRNYTVGEAVPGSRDATYELTVNFKGYGCNRNGVIYQFGETATWLYIQVNTVRPFNINFETLQHFLSPRESLDLYTIPPAKVLRTPSPPDTDRKKIDATLSPSIEALANFTFEQEYDSTPVSYNTREVSQLVFITPDNQLPYDPVSIGEFLDLNERLLKAMLADNECSSGVESYPRLLARIPVLKQRYEQQLEDPVYIRDRSWVEHRLDDNQPFVEPENGYLLCRRSDKYGSKKDNYHPKFLVVAWRWQPEVPYSVRVHEALKNNFNFQALKGLLQFSQ